MTLPQRGVPCLAKPLVVVTGTCDGLLDVSDVADDAWRHVVRHVDAQVVRADDVVRVTQLDGDRRPASRVACPWWWRRRHVRRLQFDSFTVTEVKLQDATDFELHIKINNFDK